MTTAVTDIERPAILFADGERNVELSARRPQALDHVLVRVWEDLSERGVASCLVCGGEMVQSAAEIAATCATCRSVLS